MVMMLDNTHTRPFLGHIVAMLHHHMQHCISVGFKLIGVLLAVIIQGSLHMVAAWLVTNMFFIFTFWC
jgi:hypothetical protein